VDIKVAGSDTVHVTSTGLGIGTNAPSEKLVIANSSNLLKFGLDSSSHDIFSNGKTFNIGTTDGTVARFFTNNTEHMRIDENGHVTKPLQSAFSVTESGSQANIGVQSTIDLLFDTEVFDVNGDFASSTFTAPVTGKYILCGNITINNMDQDADFTSVTIDTSNRNYTNIVDPEGFDKDVSYFSFTITVVADMDASDTAKMTFYQSAGSAVADLAVGQSYFSGYLLG
jgi:hypothetical protein